ncbi:MAG: lactate utilization protein B, partial [Phycisphaeraceae bacterium]|nr:lactate utilization protein B [Phycisphaeraceae bacterium]
DAEQANRICLEIAEAHKAKLCVKSKSMVTEETHLVPALESMGCETIETDLGEFILQVDHDAPSHIVTPMIHKDRTAVARAFERELGAEYTEDAQALTQIARNHLREKYRRADLGISGGNFLVADSGSVVICTNEGNGRLCTSAPKVHVAFVGIEKMVPDFDRLGVLLKMLARSSTGQPLTVYTHVMTGPRRAEEPDGPEEMHVVLIDNGRTKILEPETREMLRCIRCGACLNACPVYRKVGGHSYGAVYSGPIGALITPMFKGLENYQDLPNASSLCGACYEACPVKIDIPKYLIQLREMMVDRRLAPIGDRLLYRLWATAVRHPVSYRLGGWFQKQAFRLKARLGGTIEANGDPYADRGWLSHVPGPVAGWTDQRDLPTPPSKSFRQWWNSREKESEAPAGEGVSS